MSPIEGLPNSSAHHRGMSGRAGAKLGHAWACLASPAMTGEPGNVVPAQPCQANAAMPGHARPGPAMPGHAQPCPAMPGHNT